MNASQITNISSFHASYATSCTSSASRAMEQTSHWISADIRFRPNFRNLNPAHPKYNNHCRAANFQNASCRSKPHHFDHGSLMTKTGLHSRNLYIIVLMKSVIEKERQQRKRSRTNVVTGPNLGKIYAGTFPSPSHPPLQFPPFPFPLLPFFPLLLEVGPLKST